MSGPEAKKDKAMLTLGWKVTDALEPRYWRGLRAKAGFQSDDDLVRIPADRISSHTAIIAQSGSGKSFFLGRLIEEILLHTKARCIVLDPNADFRRVDEVESNVLWTTAKYHADSGRGKLPHEKSRREFEKQWRSCLRENIRIRTGGGIPAEDNQAAKKNQEALQLSWPALSMDFLAEEIEPMQRSDLYHCHTFVQGLELLFKLFETSAYKRPADLISKSEQFFRQARLLEGDFRSNLESEFNINELLKTLFGERPDLTKTSSPLYAISELIDFPLLPYFRIPQVIHEKQAEFILTKQLDTMQNVLQAKVRLAIDGICKAPKYVSEVVEHFYFSKAREYESAGILQTGIQKRRQRSYRLEIIDLPSLKKKSTVMLAINAVLDREWDQARRAWNRALEMPANKDDRVPTFIIVDEAHNLIPAEPLGKAEAALSEQFRKIVAEGRKYGLYLMLVSQRPDKLDPLVLSECENKAIMRLSSGSVLDLTRRMLGLDNIQPKTLEKCLDFGPGRVFLVGRWALEGAQLLYSGARRTVEGGRNLREDYWAAPPDIKQRHKIKTSKTVNSSGQSKTSGSSKSVKKPSRK